MNGNNEVKGSLIIQPTKKGRSFLVTYTTPKGKLIPRMAVMPKAMHFEKAKAVDGDEVIITLTDGQITKCVIPGKEAEPEAPSAGKTASAGRRNSYSGHDRTSRSLPASGGSGQTMPRSRGPAVRDAVAPYNFVPYAPEAVLAALDEGRGTWSGVLRCRLRALAPLLVAGERTKRADDSSECRFFTVDGTPVIPGSGIKGVLRSMVEILSFSALRQTSHKELFWRIVTGALYQEAFTDEILGGYLCREGAEYTLFPSKVEKINRADTLTGGERVKTGGMPLRNGKTSCDYKFYPPSSHSLPVAREVVADFKRQMTENQRSRWKEECCSHNGHPVFYRKGPDGSVAELGLCRYFRRKYDKSPADLCDAPEAMDFAEKLFGKVGLGTSAKDGDRARTVKGRVSVMPAEVRGSLYKEHGCDAILGTPHPTSLAHYIEQKPSRIRTISGGVRNDPESLAAYGSGERLRGRKLYWHHDVDESLWFTEGSKDDLKSKSVLTHLYPLASGASAEVDIHLDRLTDLELGCILEALSLASGDHAWKLGMGKPLGFGSVMLELERAEVSDVRVRYTSLAARLGGEKPCLDKERQEGLRAAFRAYVLEKVNARYPAWRADDYDSLPPIMTLRLMTDYKHRPSPDKVRYMSLKEFKRKALLGYPEEVMKKN